jgi:hypothetical protein
LLTCFSFPFAIRFPIIARYGVVAGLGLSFFVTDVPIIRRDVFSRIPVLRDAYPAYNEED